jgi:hypothetical protein
MSNRISGAPIHFNVDDELFNLVVTGGFIQTDEATAQHGHPYSHHLARTEMTVGLSRGS